MLAQSHPGLSPACILIIYGSGRHGSGKIMLPLRKRCIAYACTDDVSSSIISLHRCILLPACTLGRLQDRHCVRRHMHVMHKCASRKKIASSCWHPQRGKQSKRGLCGKTKSKVPQQARDLRNSCFGFFYILCLDGPITLQINTLKHWDQNRIDKTRRPQQTTELTL